MKKLIATALTGTLLLTATGAAMAQPYRGHNTVRYDRGYRHNNTGAAIGLGLGLFALGAIIASSQNRYEDRYDDRYGYRYAPPPPPPPAYRYQGGYYYGR